MSSAVRMGVKRVAMAAVRPAVQVAPRRALSSERSQTLLQNQAKFQQNPHLHRADNPTYLKRGAADYAVNAIGGLLALSGLYRIGNGLYHMSFGTDVLDIQ